MTLSTMRNDLLRYVPGLHPEIVSSIIQDSYRQLCDKEWNILDLVRQINTVGTYSTGTVTVSASGIVTGTSTVFTSAMIGRYMKVYYSDSFFKIASWTSETSITLEDWPGSAVTSATTYSIFKNIYTLDSSIKQIYSVNYQTSLPKKSQTYFNRIDPSRFTTGTPCWWAFAGYDASNNIQIEVYPPPDGVYPLRIYGKRKITALGESASPILSEDLVMAHALLHCYRMKETLDPKKGWGERAAEQVPIYQEIYNNCKEEDYKLEAHRQRVRDDMGGFEDWPVSDTFAASHDVE